MCRELSCDDALEPLGDFDEVACDAEWHAVLATAASRAASAGEDLHNPSAAYALYVGEAIGDHMQATDDAARKGLAFCQTPGFVAEYLLDHVLVAFDRYGAHNQGRDGRAEDGSDDEDGRTADVDQRIRLLDPSCGAGHLLVRAAQRIHRILAGGWRAVDTLEDDAPATSATSSVLAAWACDVVTGYELNPQAAAVARVRLAAWLFSMGPAPAEHHSNREWHAALDRVLADDGAVQVRDSLLDPGEDRFEMIVGNPPYITPKDKAQRDAIRARYASAHGRYGLHGPFIEAALERWLMPGGFMCYITANNFQKREWGKPLIEQVLAKHDLRFVTDTSGAFIPGHGTPTCILGARGFAAPTEAHPWASKRGKPAGVPTVRMVQGKRGEPSTPADPAKGRVWTAIRARTAQTVGAMLREPRKPQRKPS